MPKGGGGHGSGTVDYQGYVKTFHSQLLQNDDFDLTGSPDSPDISVIDAMNTAWGVSGNPYTDATRPSGALAFNPATDITAVETELAELDVLADARDPKTDWEDYVDKVLLKLGDTVLFPSEDIISSLSTTITNAITAATALLTSTPITDAVTSFENEQKNRFLQGTARFAAGMADINAVNSSSFIIGLALREMDFDNQVNGFKANLQLGLYNNATNQALESHLKATIQRHGIRDMYITRATHEMMSLLSEQLKASSVNAQLLLNQRMQKIVAESDQNNYDLDLDVKESLWDLRVFEYGNSTLSSIAGSGGATQGEGTSAWKSALSGGIAGASAGGSVGGPWGAAIGAGIGITLGLFS